MNRKGIFLLLALLLLSLACQTIVRQPASTFEPADPPPAVSATATATARALLPSATSVSIPTDPLDQFEISVLYFDHLITGLYHMYGKSLDNLVDIEIVNHGSSAAHLRVENEVVGFSTPAVSSVSLAAGESVTLHHNPTLRADAIDSLMNQRQASLDTRITLVTAEEEIELHHETVDILMYARRDFPAGVYPQRPFYSLVIYMSAWVTPNDPAIEELLRQAADWHADGAITAGYPNAYNDDNLDVFHRLEAIWNAVAYDYQVKYLSTTVSFAPGAVQRIRLPGEVLEQRAGNCIELTMLLASAAEAIDLETNIILIPGHAFLGVRTAPESGAMYYIETTMVADATLREAVEVGNREYNTTKDHTAAEGYMRVNIPEARSIGIGPMPWR
ncbi:MAG TPA: hypothetical protein VLS48_00075 [Anaerolineales bacterium]|nr:hypothetical protein [Anaerolineales bacterium]